MQNHNSAGGVGGMRGRRRSCGNRRTCFDKLDACLAKAIMSVGAVKAVEIGDGCSVSTAAGTENNDAFYMENEQIAKNKPCRRHPERHQRRLPYCASGTSNPPSVFLNRKP